MSLFFPFRRALSRPYGIPLGLPWIKLFNQLAFVVYRDIRSKLGHYGELTRLASKLPTDKGVTFFPFHGYTPHYESVFRMIRHRTITILEIGLSRKRDRSDRTVSCPSLSLWSAYFPHATILGFDIDDFSMVRQPRTTIFRGDQGNPEDLLNMVNRFPSLDVVIDDGSHASFHQQTSLKTLWPYLSDTGIYVIEDLDEQPRHLECSLPRCLKTRDLLSDRRSIEGLITNVGSIEFFDSPLRNAAQTMACISKLPK